MTGPFVTTDYTPTQEVIQPNKNHRVCRRM